MARKKQNSGKKAAPVPVAKETAFPYGSLIIALIALSVSVLGYKAYKNITTPAELPTLDYDAWWGPNDTRTKQDISIRPFKIVFTDTMAQDLTRRLQGHKPFTPPLEGAAFTYGFNTEALDKIIEFWRLSYDFKKREKFLNKFNHFKTNIQGLDIHYLHVKPNVPQDVKVYPLLLLHGWPGSVREFYELIPLLITPMNGYVFEVIAPSLPGFGYSQASVRRGLGPAQASIIMRNLMQRIGIKKFFIQGGDAGHVVGANLATIYPDEVLGFHTNMPMVGSPVQIFKWFLGALWPSLVVEEEFADRMYPLSSHLAEKIEESGYIHIQATKPDTIGAALTDSPSGLAAYILEKFSTWTDPSFKLLDDGGLTKKYTLTDLLDNVMIYWATNSITSSVRFYAESFSADQMKLNLESVQTPVPTWALKLRHELLYQPDSFIKTKYVNLLGSSIVKDGGHFAAFEKPALLAADIFKAVKSFVQFNANRK